MRKLRTQHEPPSPGPELEILRVKDSAIHPFVVLSAKIFGLWTHWDQKALNGRGASSPCFGDEKVCDGHKRRLPERWKGYLHVHHLHTKKDGFLELTPTAAGTLKSCLVAITNYRGVRINVARSSNSEKGRLRVTVFDSVQDMSGYPKERCPTETLSKLWKLRPDLDDDAPPSLVLHCGPPSDPKPLNGNSAASG